MNRALYDSRIDLAAEKKDFAFFLLQKIECNRVVTEGNSLLACSITNQHLFSRVFFQC